MLFDVSHQTRHTYPVPACDSHNEIRLQPLSDDQQELLGFSVRCDPPAHFHHYDLQWGRVHHFHVREAHSCLTVEACSRIRTLLNDPFEGNACDPEMPDTVPVPVRGEQAEWLLSSGRVPLVDPDCNIELDALARLARQERDAGGVVGFATAVMRLIHREWPYTTNATHVGTTLPELLRDRRGGVCQDFAHLMLGICRRNGIPSRYVSGYLYTGRGLHSGDVMHAWVECLVPTVDGRWVWRGFDPTNNLLAGKSYIKVHFGRDYADVTPTRGIYCGAAATSLEVQVRVVPVEERDSMPVESGTTTVRPSV